MREETVTVKIDHPLGSTDEDNPSVVYPINCGYVDVERTAGFSELDKQRVYLLGVDVAVDEYIGELIAVARRPIPPISFQTETFLKYFLGRFTKYTAISD